MVKTVKTWISWEQNIIFLRNNKILNLYLRWYILRSCGFVAEVTFKELPFYKKHIQKAKINCFKNTDLPSELPFYEELNVTETNQSFRGNVKSYKEDPIKQLEASKSIKDLFSDLLNEEKGFRYQIILKFMLRKYKTNGEIGLRPIYFNSTTKNSDKS